MLIQLFLPYLDNMQAQLSVWGGKGSTEVDLELLLHKSHVRGKATVAVMNAKMESGENNLDGKMSVVLIS